MEILLIGLVCLAALAWVFVRKTSKNDENFEKFSAPYKVEPPVQEQVAAPTVEPVIVAKTDKKSRKPRATKAKTAKTTKTNKKNKD